jgi:hypothetical protein
MFRLAKWLPCMAVLAGAIMLSGPPAAHATFTLTITDVGTSSTTTITGSGGNVATGGFITVGNFKVSLSGSSSAPNNSPADVNQVTLNTNYTGSGADTLKVTIKDDGFTGFASGQVGTLNTSITSTSEAANATANVTGFYTDGGGTTTGAASVSGAVGAPNTLHDGSSKTFTTGGGATFTLGSELDISVTGPSSNNDYNIDTNVIVPAPASVVMAFSALPFLGLGAWVRRRKVVPMAV